MADPLVTPIPNCAPKGVQDLLYSGLKQGAEAQTALESIESSIGQNIPKWDYMVATRYGSTNNLHVITFKTGGSGGTTVATVTLTYFGSGASNDDTIETCTIA
jgi:hypothetical protein